MSTALRTCVPPRGTQLSVALSTRQSHLDRPGRRSITDPRSGYLAAGAEPLACSNVTQTTCGRRESNPHARRHQILSLAWLPLHHSRVAGSLGGTADGGDARPVQGSAATVRLPIGWCRRTPPVLPQASRRPSSRRSGRLSPVPRSPEQIQQEIDAARESLGATLDELAFRASPQRLRDQARDKAQAFLQSPPGMAIVGAVGLTVTFVVTRKVVRSVRSRRAPQRRSSRR